MEDNNHHQQQTKGVRGYSFTNWSKTFSCAPELYFTPESEDEIRNIVGQAEKQGRRVRAVGCGNSPSDIACTDEYMISMKKMNKLIEVDEEKYTVTVQAGVTLETLCEKYLPKNNLALSVVPSFPKISLGGCISTGTHASGLKFGNLASYVLELDLLLASGEKIHCSREENEEIFKSACCGLGALGVILTIKIQCEPAFRLEQNTYPAALFEVLESLDVHLTSSEHFRFLWYPHTDQVTVSHASRTKKPHLKLPILSRLSNWFWQYVVGFYLLEFCYWISTYCSHRLVPIINRLFFHLTYSQQSHSIDDGHKIFTFECLFKQYVNEWAVPREKCSIVLYRLNEWIESNPKAYAHFPVEVRFVKEDDFYISPASQQTMCYFNIINYRPYGVNLPNQAYWESYENIIKSEGGRPHWAKAHKQTYKDFKVMYPKWDKWCEIRKKLDPRGTFSNAYVERIFDGQL